MKKLIVTTATVLLSVHVFGQLTVSGDIQYSSKNVSLGTGLVFSEDPAMILHFNTGYQYKDFSTTIFYSGHTGIQRLNPGDQYHIVDMLASYKLGDFNLYVGPEFSYKDLPDTDKTGAGVVGMLIWGKEKMSFTFTFYTDIKFQLYYYILSGGYSLTESLSIYGLVAYTTAESTPFYGMAGLKYTKGQFYAGTYYVFREQVPGPMFNVGITFGTLTHYKQNN